MYYKLIIIALFSITATFCVDITQTKIATTRNQLRTSLCNFYNGNFTDSDRLHASKLITTYNYLTDQQIQAMLFTQNFSSPAIQSFLIVAPHAACLVILIIMIPGLACCCARPQKYPVCKKFRKPENQMYTKVQLKWPSFMTIFCYLTISTGAAVALAGGPDITNYVNNIGCRLTALIDDTLNGRISPENDTIFFVGLTPLKSQLSDFNSKYNTFFSQSNTSFNSSHSIRTMQLAIQNQISSTYTSYNDISYTNAFRQSDGATYAPIASRFKSMYFGPVTDSTKILGNIYNQLQTLFTQINAALDPLISAWDYLQGQGQLVVTNYISNTITNIGLHQVQLTKTLTNYEYFDNQQYYNSINLSIKAIYGIVLAMGLLGLISAIVITCCTVVRIRMIIYFTCSFLIFMGVITFCMLIVFAIFLPNVSQACAYIDRKMETSAGIVSLLNNLQFNASASLYSNCLKQTGNGDMVGSVNNQFLTSFQSIVLISANTLNFNDLIPNFSVAKFQQPFTQAASVITSLKTLTSLQIQDTTALNFLTALANKAYAKDPTHCSNQANINGDSWVPSRNVISCQGGTYAQSPCIDLSSTVTCSQGCYEIYQQLNTPPGDSTSYSTHLNLRYGSGCNYAQYLIDLQQNWIMPLGSNLANVQTNINTIKTNVNNYRSSVASIQGNVNGFQSNLVQNFNSQTNQLTGSFNGVDCRVVGQSMIQLRDAVCVGLLTSIQYNTIMLCLMSYGILLLSCFSVCAGVRHYQHLQKMQVKVGYKGVPVSISSNRIIDKFDA